jgi:hypothetical protein
VSDADSVASSAQALVQATVAVADGDTLTAVGAVGEATSGSASLMDGVEQLEATASTPVAGASSGMDAVEQIGAQGGVDVAGVTAIAEVSEVVAAIAEVPVRRAEESPRLRNERDPSQHAPRSGDRDAFYGRSRKRWVRR